MRIGPEVRMSAEGAPTVPGGTPHPPTPTPAAIPQGSAVSIVCSKPPALGRSPASSVQWRLGNSEQK